MRTLIATALLAAAAIVPAAAQAQTAGTYRAQGSCPGQPKPYVGLVTISGNGPVYRWSERIGSGQTFEGVLVVQGDTLSVGFTGEFRGVLQATRTRNGWEGVWAGAAPNAAMCREVWVRD